MYNFQSTCPSDYYFTILVSNYKTPTTSPSWSLIIKPHAPALDSLTNATSELMFNSPIGGGVHVCTGDGDGALTI
jgi:hypothetical protein